MRPPARSRCHSQCVRCACHRHGGGVRSHRGTAEGPTHVDGVRVPGTCCLLSPQPPYLIAVLVASRKCLSCCVWHAWSSTASGSTRPCCREWRLRSRYAQRVFLGRGLVGCPHADVVGAQDKVASLEVQAQRVLGRPLLVTSPQDVSKALFVDLKLTPPRWATRSARGHMPTSEGVLQAIRCDVSLRCAGCASRSHLHCRPWLLATAPSTPYLPWYSAIGRLASC